MNSEKSISSPLDLKDAYDKAIKFATSHYENFPVLSVLIPKNLRKHVAVIYQFARQADDLADEGDISAKKRIEELNDYENKLSECLEGKFENDFWAVLKNTIWERNLTAQYFYDLLKAFKHDVEIKRYGTFKDILYYCKHSANPVGRLVLELFNIRNEQLNIYSDNVCTALQLANFYQDVGVDIEKGRIYIPLDEMKKFGVEENVFVKKKNNVKFKELLRHQVEKKEKMSLEGRKLLRHLPYRLKLEIGWTILGGEKILEKIESLDYEVLNNRPKLSKAGYLTLMLKSFFI